MSLPFVASDPGEVPESGEPTLAGVQLPAGVACPGDGPSSYWRTLEPVDDPARLTGPLTQAFAQTGLWPVLYAWEEPPENYWPGGPDVALRTVVDVVEVMQTQWETWKQSTWGPRPIFPEFPGLAESSSTIAAGDGDPFAFVNDESRREPWEARRWLLLVPCRRPADILAQVGWDFSQMPFPIMTALLRSWEERFAAVPVQIDLATVTLNIGRPLTNREQAERLVGELAAVCQLSIDADAEWLARTASLLLPGSPLAPLQADLSPTHWRISFRETAAKALVELFERPRR